MRALKHKVLKPDWLPYDVNGTSRTQVVREVPPPTTAHLRKRGRYWAVLDAGGELICLTVYRKGGMEVLRRLGQ